MSTLITILLILGAVIGIAALLLILVAIVGVLSQMKK